MKKVYINGMGCVSAQDSQSNLFPENILSHTEDNVIYACEPSYKEMIPPAAARRMAKGIKMSIAASKKALQEAEVTSPDAIITGTGMGCLVDSEKFLRNILDNQEQFLTPTAFIQSTHNTVAGQIALDMGCTAYNFTYVNGAVSLASALMDAQMQLTGEMAQTVLAGGVDETAPHTIMLYRLINLIKNETINPDELLKSTTPGTLWGEGAAFFVLENQPKPATYATLETVEMQNTLQVEEVHSFIQNSLSATGLNPEDIDLVVLGNNGDINYDTYYDKAAQLFPQASQVAYKHLSGEFNTASGFALWMSLAILKSRQIPDVIRLNEVVRKPYKTVLLYNQFLGKDHSVIILKK